MATVIPSLRDVRRKRSGLMKNESEDPEFCNREFPVREDMAYQLRMWRFERYGWYLLVMLVVLSLAGLFSRGPLSSSDVRSKSGNVRVEHEMFNRNGSSNAMRISLAGSPESTIELEVAGELWDGFIIETLHPQPLRSRSSAQGMRLLVQLDRQGQAVLLLTLRAEGLGLFRSRIASAGSGSVDINQFIFP